MTMPNTNITKQGGNLGRTGTSLDGVAALILTGVAVGGQFALGDIVGPFYQLSDAEAKGIDATYDIDNKVLVYKHIKDFYDQAEAMDKKGQELYVMILDEDITMEDMCNKANEYAKKLSRDLAGRIRLMGITRVPPVAYAPSYGDHEFDPDVFAAITKAQALIDEEFDLHRPMHIIIEGRDFQGTSGDADDLRALDAEGVSVVCFDDPDHAKSHSQYSNFASVGLALGYLSTLPVQRSLGRVKNGAMVYEKIGLSDSSELYIEGAVYNEDDLGNLDTKGYIFARQHQGKTGFFFNNDHCCIPLTSDFAYIRLNRTIDKVCRLAREVYVEDILDEMNVDPDTGYISAEEIKSAQAEIDTKVNNEMVANGELSGFSSFIDPEQDVLSSDEFNIELNPIPVGVKAAINITVGYENPAA